MLISYLSFCYWTLVPSVDKLQPQRPIHRRVLLVNHHEATGMSSASADARRLKCGSVYLGFEWSQCVAQSELWACGWQVPQGMAVKERVGWRVMRYQAKDEALHMNEWTMNNNHCVPCAHTRTEMYACVWIEDTTVKPFSDAQRWGESCWSQSLNICRA